VTSIKIDPYLNTDAGTMSPYEHGEVFVLNDGGEVDLDLGNYERFLGVTLSGDHNITTGKIYSKVIEKERRGDYLGKTVQVVPHITEEIQNWIANVAKMPVTPSEDGKEGKGPVPEVCMIELGGTVGDIESSVFLEALRQFRYKVGSSNFCHIHVSLVPVVGAVGEPKTKPTQHGIKELRAAGLSPDLVVCRSSKPLTKLIIDKISLFCMVPTSHIISVHDVSNIYRVPLLLYSVTSKVLASLGLNNEPKELTKWKRIAEVFDSAEHEVRIGIVGKYTGLADSYLSVIKGLQHAGIDCGVKVKILWLESGDLEEKGNKAWETLKTVHGILVPGGFGDRGIPGKVLAINFARLNDIPFFGICLGMQMAVIEIARNVLNLEDANSTEFDQETTNPVVIPMPELSTSHMGGTMRLGARITHIQKDSLAYKIYQQEEISERHRHRYEVNPKYIQALEEKGGLRFSGKDDTKNRMEITELPSHRFFIGCQYHPEFQSIPERPSPIFCAFMRASNELSLELEKKEQVQSGEQKNREKGQENGEKNESTNSKTSKRKSHGETNRTANGIQKKNRGNNNEKVSETVEEGH